MADFLTAYKITAKNEGGYANVEGDRGGETYCGITRPNFPKWAGWVKVDAYKPLKNGQIVNDATLEDLVHSFYKQNFWDKVKGDDIINQESANGIYDFAVNAGYRKAIILAQRALQIKETGVMDSTTLDTINNTQKFEL
jgi:lysozyme family protein